MKKRLSLKVLVPLIFFTLIAGALPTGLAEGLTEGILIGHFRQRAIALGKQINQEFYERYFNPRYEIEKDAFNPLAPKQMKELDALIQNNMRHFEVERVNFFSQTGQVIYSTERELVGTDASSISQVQRALRGQVTSKVVYGFRPDRLHGKAGTLLNHHVIEVYLPMLCLNQKLPIYGKQVGVLELYQNTHVVRRWLNRIRLYLGGMLLLTWIALTVSSFSTLRLADLKPLRQRVTPIGESDISKIVTEGKLPQRIDRNTSCQPQGRAGPFNRMVGAVLKKRWEHSTERSRRRLDEAREMAMVDKLTLLYNHRYFHRRLEEELARAARTQSDVALVICDLDGFNVLNDTQGYQAGDLGLKEIARIIRDSRRASDIACRYGGDEFALILPGTNRDEARALAERLRAEVQDRFRGRPEEWGEGLTLSIGIAAYPKDATEKKALIERANWAMYYARRSGKDQVKGFDLFRFIDFPFADSREERLLSLRTLVGALRGEDGYLHRHSESVAAHSAMVAQQMGLEPLGIDQILVAGLLHDIGIIVLPNQILSKAGKLAEEEMEQVRQHPILAVSLLESIEGLREVLPFILHHHEHYAGGGYPKGSAHPQIPLGSRILAVVDAYHAMRSVRPFRRALTHEEAVEELRRCRGTQFDPDVVETFLQCLSTANSCTTEEE